MRAQCQTLLAAMMVYFADHTRSIRIILLSLDMEV